MFPHKPNVSGSIARAVGNRKSDCVLNCSCVSILSVRLSRCQRWKFLFPYNLALSAGIILLIFELFNIFEKTNIISDVIGIAK